MDHEYGTRLGHHLPLHPQVIKPVVTLLLRIFLLPPPIVLDTSGFEIPQTLPTLRFYFPPFVAVAVLPATPPAPAQMAGARELSHFPLYKLNGTNFAKWRKDMDLRLRSVNL